MGLEVTMDARTWTASKCETGASSRSFGACTGDLKETQNGTNQGDFSLASQDTAFVLIPAQAPGEPASQ